MLDVQPRQSTAESTQDWSKHFTDDLAMIFLAEKGRNVIDVLLRKNPYSELNQRWLDTKKKLRRPDKGFLPAYFYLLPNSPQQSNQLEKRMSSEHAPLLTAAFQSGIEVVWQKTLVERADLQSVPAPLGAQPELKWLKPLVAISVGSSVPQEIELKHFKDNLPQYESSQIIALLRRSGHTHVADRLYELQRLDDDDEQMLVSSLRVAVYFLSDPSDESGKIGVDYPAVWLSADGYLRLFWRREDRSRSLIVTCLTEGFVRLEIYEHDEDRTIELSYDEAINQVHNFVAHI